MEADFNFFNGLVFAKHLMHWAEHNDWILCEIYGSQKNHEAIEVALNHRLIMDISQQCQVPLAITYVDAQTCYDCMAHSIASIASQCLQVDPPGSGCNTIYHSGDEVLPMHSFWGLDFLLWRPLRSSSPGWMPRQQGIPSPMARPQYLFGQPHAPISSSCVSN